MKQTGKKLIGAKTTTFIHDKDIFVLNRQTIRLLKQAASRDPSGRARICLHRHHSDLVQEMIITLQKGTYVRPHRHTGKTESIHIIEGKLTVLFFNNRGDIVRNIVFSKSAYENPFIYRLSSEFWHMVIPISQFAVFHEVTSGPFTQSSSEFAPWSPEEHDVVGIRSFFKSIEGKIKQRSMITGKKR